MREGQLSLSQPPRFLGDVIVQVLEEMEDFRFKVASICPPHFAFTLESQPNSHLRRGDFLSCEIYVSTNGKLHSELKGVLPGKPPADRRVFHSVSHILLQTDRLDDRLYKAFLLNNSSSHEFLDFIYRLAALHPNIEHLEGHRQWIQFWMNEDLEIVEAWNFEKFHRKFNIRKFQEDKLVDIKSKLMVWMNGKFIEFH